MTVFLLIVAVILGVSLWYALAGRAWLKSKPWSAGFFAWIEPAEIALFRKSETILIGRLLWFGSLLVTFYDSFAVWASSLDLTPITTRVFDALHVPNDIRGIVVSAGLAAIGFIVTWLRKRVTMPIELVAVPDAKVASNPRVAEAVAMADATKTEAVAVVARAA